MKLKKIFKFGALLTSPIMQVSIVSCGKNQKDVNSTKFFEFESPMPKNNKSNNEISEKEKFQNCQNAYNKIIQLASFKNALQSDFDANNVSEYGPEKILDFKAKDGLALLKATYFNKESEYEKIVEVYKSINPTGNFNDYLTNEYKKMTSAINIYLKAEDNQSAKNIKEELNDPKKVKEINNKVNNIKETINKLIDKLNENPEIKSKVDESLKKQNLSIEKIKEKISGYDNNEIARGIFLGLNGIIKNKDELFKNFNLSKFAPIIPNRPFDNLNESLDVISNVLSTANLF